MMKQFVKDQQGNFALTLAIAALPIMLCAGVAVDYAGVSRERGNLQDAVDAALLAVGQDFKTMKKKDIRKALMDMLRANLSREEYARISSLKPVIDKKTHTLTVTASAEFDTSFMALAGKDKLPYHAISQIKSAGGGAEIAFVLDNTGSMSVGGKMDALKKAATGFTKGIMTKANGGDMKIAIVPFSNHVNVGLSNRKASWLDVEDDRSETKENVCYNKRDVISKSNCRKETYYSDGVPYETEVCDYTYGEPYEVCGPQTNSYTWHGCVGSRRKPLNLRDRRYSVRVPGLMNVWCGAEITPLTNNREAIIKEIDGMVAGGDTYIPAGLTWGLRVLSSGRPFNQGVSKTTAKKKNIKKYLVLMTDGDNTRSAQLPDAPTHWGSDADQANAWTAEACRIIKKQDISVFTITFGTLLDDTKKLMRNCASGSRQYYHAASGAELSAVFEDIRGQISALHLSM
ncbi:pilus assembly protein [Salaquimonas pukyongi]|uniref:pilus assembly protein n=1 Tax=Salaquimonas pukyongi TaxID=2712698 RepID=UPI00096B758D|nr:pilus assembly protein [Salaquimonas pukyongi]